MTLKEAINSVLGEQTFHSMWYSGILKTTILQTAALECFINELDNKETFVIQKAMKQLYRTGEMVDWDKEEEL